MSDEEKEKIVKEMIDGFDFDMVRSVMYLTQKDIHVVPIVSKLKQQAEKLIRMTFDHQDREFWWAGGLSCHGGLCACYDNKCGFSLNYVFQAKKVKGKAIEK